MTKCFYSSTVLVISALILLVCHYGGLQAWSANAKDHLTVHGRLAIYNGNPTFRIWIVGTNRLLGVPGGDLEPAEMPHDLEKLFTGTSIIVYGDFVVTPLTEYKPGVMQFVRIQSARNLVIYDADKFIKKTTQIDSQQQGAPDRRERTPASR